jgi:hypothetical protein
VWSKKSLVQEWFTDDKGVLRIKATDGMNSLAKDLAVSMVEDGELTVNLHHRVSRLERIVTGGGKSSPSSGSKGSSTKKWRIHFDDQSQAPAEAAVVVLTCPLPQALAILASSDLPYDRQLDDVQYARALVLLYSPRDAERDKAFRAALDGSSRLVNSNGFYAVRTTSTSTTAGDNSNDNDNGDGKKESVSDLTSGIFSIADQRAKGVSATPSYSIIMTPPFSELHYGDAAAAAGDSAKGSVAGAGTDDEAIARIDEELQALLFDSSGDNKNKNKKAASFSLKGSEGSASDGEGGDLLFLKRWRYSHPLNPFQAAQPFVEIQLQDDNSGSGSDSSGSGGGSGSGSGSGLFLAGDAFGGPSVPGAVSSATALAEYLQQQQQAAQT